MRNPIPRLLSVLLFAPILTAQSSTIKFEPPDPTSKTPIILIVTESDSCPPAPEVSRVGNVITVRLGAGPCLSPPTEITHRISIGTLPAGEYEVIVTDDGVVAATTTLTVLDESSSVTVRPSLGPATGGTQVLITASVHLCASCPPPAITFGGVPATNVTVVDATTYRATTPPHAAGAVEVRVASDTTETASHSFRYYDPAAAPLPALFERILVPVVYNGPGAHGSMWSTELSMRNATGYGVTLWRPTRGLPVIPPSRPQMADPGQSFSGLFLIAPREASQALHLNLRVRDTSRESNGWGTELPIVRERDFSPEPFELLSVPRDSRYRTTLRIYLLGSYPAFARVVIYSMVDGRVMGHGLVPLESGEPCSGADPCNGDKPSFSVINDVAKYFHIPANDAFGIRVEPWGPVALWAFVTVTNNETQHVTVISPQ